MKTLEEYQKEMRAHGKPARLVGEVNDLVIKYMEGFFMGLKPPTTRNVLDSEWARNRFHADVRSGGSIEDYYRFIDRCDQHRLWTGFCHGQGRRTA